MTTEEVDLNERLEREGVAPVETDLGEYIVQIAHERPYHLVAPALHKTRFDVADLFSRELGIPRETEIEKQTKIAPLGTAPEVPRGRHRRLRRQLPGGGFRRGVIVTNEGNGRMTTTLPKVHVAHRRNREGDSARPGPGGVPEAAGPQRHWPAADRLHVVPGGARAGAGEIDGPEEFYVVLLDNGRTRLLADREKRQSLYCIRCGACLNHCPVYRKVGGHSYPASTAVPSVPFSRRSITACCKTLAPLRLQPVRRLRGCLSRED